MINRKESKPGYLPSGHVAEKIQDYYFVHSLKIAIFCGTKLIASVFGAPSSVRQIIYIR